MNATQILDLKARVRQRDGNKCVVCGMTSKEHVRKYGRILDVHRIEPGSPYTEEGCRTLCKPCHGLEACRPRGTPDMGTGTPVYRVTFDAESEEVRRAVYIAAAMRGVSVGDLLCELIREKLPEAMALAEQAVAKSAASPAPL